MDADTLELLIRFENGRGIARNQMIDLFAALIRSGAAWKLQGSYGRSAADLIEAGIISETGDVIRYPDED